MTDTKRVNILLLPKAATALDEVTASEGFSQTDVVNRALQAYAFLLKAREAGGAVYVRESAGADLFQVEFL